MEIKQNKTLDAQIYGYIGRGVLSVRVDEAGHLIFTMSDGSEIDLGRVNSGGSGGESGGVGIELDTTLTRAGAAAEAKATGDAIARVSTQMDTVRQTAERADTTARAAQETAQTARQEVSQVADTADSALQGAEQAMTNANTALQGASQAVISANAAQMTAEETSEAVGDLSGLNTEAKGSIVAAINEVHESLAAGSGGTGGGNTDNGETLAEIWAWSDNVDDSSIPLAAFPATAEGIRLKVYCHGPSAETVVFEIQPPNDGGFQGDETYGFDYQGLNVIFYDDGNYLQMQADTDLTIYGFYYSSASAANLGDPEIWRDTPLAMGKITAGTSLSRGLNTGITLGMLRAYRKWTFRLKGASGATMTDFYIKAGAAVSSTVGTSLFRGSVAGANVFFTWWDKDRTKLALRSVFVGNPTYVPLVASAVAVNDASTWLYTNVGGPNAIHNLADLEGLSDTTPVWLFCASTPSIDYEWEFRGVTR